MTPELPQMPRAQVEVRLAALLLGELPAEEAFALGRLIERDAELEKEYQRLQRTIGLVRELSREQAASFEASPTLNLSDAKRERLLQQFKTIQKTQFILPPKKPWPLILKVAAAAAMIAILAALLFPVTGKLARRRSTYRTASSAIPGARGTSQNHQNFPGPSAKSSSLGAPVASTLEKQNADSQINIAKLDAKRFVSDDEAKLAVPLADGIARGGEIVLPHSLPGIEGNTGDFEKSLLPSSEGLGATTFSFDPWNASDATRRTPALGYQSTIQDQLSSAGGQASFYEREPSSANITSPSLEVERRQLQDNSLNYRTWAMQGAGTPTAAPFTAPKREPLAEELGRPIPSVVPPVSLRENDVVQTPSFDHQEGDAGVDAPLLAGKPTQFEDLSAALYGPYGSPARRALVSPEASQNFGLNPVSSGQLNSGSIVGTTSISASPSQNSSGDDDIAGLYHSGFLDQSERQNAGEFNQPGEKNVGRLGKLPGNDNLQIELPAKTLAAIPSQDYLGINRSRGALAKSPDYSLPIAGDLFNESRNKTALTNYQPAQKARQPEEIQRFLKPLPGKLEATTVNPTSSQMTLAQSETRSEKELEQLKADTVSEPGLKPRVPSATAPVPQPEIQTHSNAFSTFSLNVSDVSFKLTAASLDKGQMPDAAGIRSEEFINAFDYRDPEAQQGSPVAFAFERAAYTFAQNRDLLRFSVKTAARGRRAGQPMNIVLLLDNSGSMERADRVRIIHEALRVLAMQLQSRDRLSVVTFSRTARLRVDGVPGDQAPKVAEQIGDLTPEGGTNLEEAMNLAYQTAARHYFAQGINRVVLLTDGAANLGEVEPEALKKKVEAQRKQGVALDCFGVGWDGYNDSLLEVLSRNGDGRYGFINTPEEAATDFAGQLAGALHVAASDVKVQVEFNPKRVSAYRQIGYAKHQLTKEQFRDNTVDAAEIGGAESGNALYVIETNPAGEGPVAIVRVRYRTPGTDDYFEHEWTVTYNGKAGALEDASPAMRLAATASAFSEWLAVNPFAGDVTTDRLLQLLQGVPEIWGADPRPKQLETMIRQAGSLAR